MARPPLVPSRSGALGYTCRVESERASETYRRSEVRRILRINENRLRAWERLGLCAVRDRYSFADLIALQTLRKLRENRIPAKRISEALDGLRRRLSNAQLPLSELRIVSDGRTIAVELPGERMEALTGQMLFCFEAKALRSVATLEAGGTRPRSVGTADGGESWFQEALDLERSGAPARQVIEAYQKVLECNPEAAGAWINIGTLHYREGHLGLAESSYRRALEVYPGYALALFNLGNVCEDLARLEEAADHYQAALRCRSDYADAHYNLALVQERRRRFLDAVKHWKSYLHLDSASPWSKIARRRSESLLRLGFPEDDSSDASFRKPLQGVRD